MILFLEGFVTAFVVSGFFACTFKALGILKIENDETGQ